MKKRILIFIIVTVTLIFSGCGQVDVSCKANDTTASMTMHLYVPNDTLTYNENTAMSKELNTLSRHLELQGWDVEYIQNDDNFVIDMSMTTECANKEEAFYALMDIMSLESSPFSYVEGGYSPSFFSDIFTLQAQLDFTKMVDYEYIDSLPTSQKERIYQALDTFSGTVIIDLPGNVIDYTGELVNNNVQITFDTKEIADISVTTKYFNTINKIEYNDIVTAMGLNQEKANLYLYLAIGFFVVLLLGIMLLVLALVKRRKSKKLENQTVGES